MGLTDQRQWAKNTTDYRQNEKKKTDCQQKKINRLPTFSPLTSHCNISTTLFVPAVQPSQPRVES